MFTTELFLGATLLCVGFTPLVFSKDAYSIKREIVDMQEHAKKLNEENAKLNESYAKLKQECDEKVKQLQEKRGQSEVHLQQLQQKLENAVLEHSKVKLEETFSHEALDSAYTMRNKYALKVELYTQELEQLQNRQKSGLSKKCHLMKPLFQSYENKLSTRSLPGGQKASERAEIILLQNSLNKDKITVTELIGKNSDLKTRIKTYSKGCEKQIKDLQDVYVENAKHISDATQNVDLLKIEIKEMRENILSIQKQLQSINQDGERLKARALALKSQVEAFFEDKRCYKRISNLNIRYE